MPIMTYSFSNLSAVDFEELVRDLIGQELSVRFEAFCAGPDGGIDGRHAPTDALKPIILQARHYVGSTFSNLKSSMMRERVSIDKLDPSRYLLATSRKLTPGNKKTLASIIGRTLTSQRDIYGPDDLNALLRKYPAVEKSHINLWLSSSVVLDRVLRSAAHVYADITRKEIEQKVRVYARNPSFTDSAERLENYHLLIISGPPGVGKTTLAEMLSYAYVSEGWELVPIRSLDDGFAAISEDKQQVLLFDDFLGRVALDKRSLAHTDSDLARLMNRTRLSPNTRFILTTRAYIFEEAREVSEYLSDQRIDFSKYVLDVGIYTRRIRARILYNHLVVSDTPMNYVEVLITSNIIPKIVDHRNYNPRVVEWMTDAFRLRQTKPEKYPRAFLAALDNPKQLWDTAFRKHIDHKCRHLLFSLFFCSEHGAKIEELREAYNSLHPVLCTKYRLAHNPKDFEEALRILEGSFVKILDAEVSYINPSFRDYLADFLNDINLLVTFASADHKIEWAQSLWNFGIRTFLSPGKQEQIAAAFLPIAEQCELLPVWRRKRVSSTGHSFERVDIGNAERISLLVALWHATENQRFSDIALRVASKPIDGFDSWLDAVDLVRLLTQLPDRDYGKELPQQDNLIALLEIHLIDLLQTVDSDDLDVISDLVDSSKLAISSSIASAVERAVLSEFDEIDDRVECEKHEFTLRENISTLQKWATRYDVPQYVLAAAISVIEERIQVIEQEASRPQFHELMDSTRESDNFDNTDLENLFAPLLDNRIRR